MSDSFRISLPLRQTDDAEPLVSAPLIATEKKMGMVPNMYRAMANFPSLLDTYQSVARATLRPGIAWRVPGGSTLLG